MKKKNLLFHYMIGGTAGGSDTCLYLLLKNLDQSKFKIFLMYNERSRFVDDLEKNGITLIPIKEYLISNPLDKKVKVSSSEGKKKPAKKSILSSVKKTIKKYPEIKAFIKIIKAHKIDLVHANHYLAGDRSAIIAARLTNTPIISHNRGLYPPDPVDKFLVKNIDEIICMSDFSKSVYTDNGIPNEKCKTIYDGIEIDEGIKFIDSNSPYKIGCFGRLETWKGQETLIDAVEIMIKKNKNFKVQLIGSGPSEEKLKTKVKEKNLSEFIEFTGHITKVKEYMNECSIVVHTSIEPEPFGMVITEAMALGKPVVATNFGGPVEIITDGKDGFLIPPKKPQLLADKLLLLLEDSNIRSQIGNGALEKVKTKFDVKKYALNIEKEYYKNIG